MSGEIEKIPNMWTLGFYRILGKTATHLTGRADIPRRYQAINLVFSAGVLGQDEGAVAVMATGCFGRAEPCCKPL
jgi:hypothetical protein